MQFYFIFFNSSEQMHTLGQVAYFKFVLMFVNYGKENGKDFSKIRVSAIVSTVL